MVIIMFYHFNLDFTLVGSKFESCEETIVGKTPLIWPVILPRKKNHLPTRQEKSNPNEITKFARKGDNGIIVL